MRDRFMTMKVAIGEIGIDRDTPAHVIHFRLDGSFEDGGVASVAANLGAVIQSNIRQKLILYLPGTDRHEPD
jgi:hypothetical protein